MFIIAYRKIIDITESIYSKIKLWCGRHVKDKIRLDFFQSDQLPVQIIIGQGKNTEITESI